MGDVGGEFSGAIRSATLHLPRKVQAEVYSIGPSKMDAKVLDQDSTRSANYIRYMLRGLASASGCSTSVFV